MVHWRIDICHRKLGCQIEYRSYAPASHHGEISKKADIYLHWNHSDLQCGISLYLHFPMQPHPAILDKVFRSYEWSMHRPYHHSHHRLPLSGCDDNL